MSSRNRIYEEEEMFKNEVFGEKVDSPTSVEITEEPEPYNSTGIVTNANYVKVRKEPSYSGAIIGTLSKGEKVEIIGEEGVFKRIRHGKDIGYVASSYCEEV